MKCGRMFLSGLGLVVVSFFGLGVGVGVSVGGSERVLPEAARGGVLGAFAGGELGEVELKRRMVVLYEVEVALGGEGGEVVDVLVTGEGVVLEVKREVGLDELPEGVREAVPRMGKLVKLEDAERVEVLGEVRGFRLGEPRLEYELGFGCGGGITTCV